MAIKQHLIDPELCIRCYTCENTCTVGAISHGDDNVVVDASLCNHCMDCVAPCPTGSIDHWHWVETPHSVEDQHGWFELPEAGAAPAAASTSVDEAADPGVAALLDSAHEGGGARAVPPLSAATPAINQYNLAKPLQAWVQGNRRLTASDDGYDAHHIILDLGSEPMARLEGQCVGVLPPGTRADGKSHEPRLYSLASPRNGERVDRNNIALTVKREASGVCSNFLCDLKVGDPVQLTGPFGATFLMPEDPDARIVMICTGTGSAPFRGFTMRRERSVAEGEPMWLYFGARSPGALPYFGPLQKVPDTLLHKRFAYSRVPGQAKQYVQDLLREDAASLAPVLEDERTHLYLCGLKAMEEGVDQALSDVALQRGLDWCALKSAMRAVGRYQVETW
ncbi:MAG: benzoyl-CoA 2,3-epoxidase subunit BoxA [Pseudomonadota bacterium]